MSQWPQNCENQVLVDHLNEMASSLSDNLQRTVKKAARNLRQHPIRVLSKQDALSVHGIGSWIATQLDVFIRNNSGLFPPVSENEAHAGTVSEPHLIPRSAAVVPPVDEVENISSGVPLRPLVRRRGRTSGTAQDRSCPSSAQGSSATVGLSHNRTTLMLQSSTYDVPINDFSVPSNAPSGAVVLPDDDISGDSPTPRSSNTPVTEIGSRRERRLGNSKTSSRKGRMKSSNVPQQNQRIRGSDDGDFEDDNNNPASGSCSQKRQSSQTKEYRPQYRSAPCAILLALKKALETNITSMKKLELAQAAQPFCDTQILTPSNDEQHTWYDGWSSVNKTLIRKGLVAKSGVPAKFQLTIEGQILADSLAVEYEDAALRTTSRFTPGSAAVHVSANCPVNSSKPSETAASQFTFDRQATIPSVNNVRSSIFSPLNHDDAFAAASCNGTHVNQSPSVIDLWDDGPERGAELSHIGVRQSELSARGVSASSELSPCSTPDFIATQELSEHKHQQPLSCSVLTTTNSEPNLRQFVPSGSTGKTLSHVQGLSFVATEDRDVQRHIRANALKRRPTSTQLSNSTWSPETDSLIHLDNSQNPVQRSRNSFPQNESCRPQLAISAVQPCADICSLSKKRGFSKRFSEAQVERSVRVVKRLREYKEEDCLSALRSIFEQGDFPKTDDKLYQALSNALWKRFSEEPTCPKSVSVEDRGTDLQHSFQNIHANTNQVEDKTQEKEIGEDSDIQIPKRILNEYKTLPKTLTHISEIENSVHVDDSTQSAPQLESKAQLQEIIEIGDSDEELEDPVRLTSLCAQQHSRCDTDTAVNAKYKNVKNSAVVQTPLTALSTVYTSHPSLGNPTDLFASDSVGHRDLSDDLVDIASEDSADVDTLPVNLDLQRSVDISVRETDDGAPVISAVRYRPSSGSQLGNAEALRGRELKTNKVIIILDKMERFRNCTSNCEWKTMAKLLEESGAGCEVRTLPCGDALFVSRFEDGSEVVLDYVIERKVVEDYVQSLRDGRVSRQAYMMRMSGIKNRLFVIEGNMRENHRIKDNPDLHKKLTELQVSGDFYVKHTKDLMDTVWFYASLRERLESKFGLVPKLALQTGRTCFDEWVEQMKRVCRSLTLEQLFMMQLCQTPGIGQTRASSILKSGICTPQLLHRAYTQIETGAERENFLANSGNGVSKSASRAICKLFTAMSYDTVMTGTSSQTRITSARSEANRSHQSFRL